MSSPPPGWYPDPWGAPAWRYWDTTGWTPYTAPMAGAPQYGAQRGPRPLPFAATRADFGRRVIGYVVDALVLFVPLMIVFFGAFAAIVIPNIDNNTGNDSFPAWFFAWLLPLELLLIAVPFLYNAFFVSNGRRTVGQRVAHLRVVDSATGAPISLGRGFVRALVAAVGSGQLFGLGYWWALWDQEQRTWHDMAASTVVIDTR